LAVQLSGYSSKGEQLLANCTSRCQTLLENFKGYDWVLTNRASFSFHYNQGGYTSVVFIGGPSRRLNRNDYLPKLEVWVAFSNKGVCEPFIQRVGEKFDHNIYLEECVKKRLVPFIKENHKNLEETILWSDALPVYFNKKTLTRLDEENIEYVQKDDIPGNRVKCFTYFWNFLRNNVYGYEGIQPWHANNENELETRIRECLKTFDMESVIRLANDTENRIDEMARIGEIKEWSDNKQNYTKRQETKTKNFNFDF